MAPQSKPKFEPNHDEKAALRGYLQRAEVRLSTMHRIAGIFLNGAGILFLLPVFLKDVVLQILTNLLPALSKGEWQNIPNMSMLLLVLVLPIYAFYLLIQDIVKFYFTAYHAGIRENFLHPRFILSGITFADDESERINQEIIEIEHSPAIRRFIVPENDEEREFYNHVYQATDGEIIPETRRKFLDEVNDDVDRQDLRLFYTAFGLTGVRDRTLSEEAAKMEMSLVRHALHLRHLVLRYVKALLMFVFTTLWLLLVNAASIAFKEQYIFSNQILSFGFSLWGFATPFIVTRPLDWISQTAERRMNIKSISSDSQLRVFERNVILISTFIFGIGLYFSSGFGLVSNTLWIVVCAGFTAFLYYYWLSKSLRKDSYNKYKEEKNMAKNKINVPLSEAKTSTESKIYEDKNPIFISYSHKDSEWLEQIRKPLRILEKQKGIQVWDDKQIKSGAKWKEEITKALHSAKVAVLLVTNDFLDSDFIQNNELPHILKTANKEGLTILWIAVKPSLYDETEIADFQSANDPSKPLNSLSEFERENEIIKICKKIQNATK